MSSIASSGVGEIGFEPLSNEDLPFLLEIRNECRHFLHDDRLFSLEDSRRWFREQRPEFWKVMLNGTAIGYFRTSNHSLEAHSQMAGADLHHDYRGKGLGLLSWMRFLDWQFGELGRSRIDLEVLETNSRAYRLYLKLGFSEVAEKTRTISRADHSIKSIFMSLTAEAWHLKRSIE